MTRIAAGGLLSTVGMFCAHPAAAAEQQAQIPKAFCADMTKTAEAGQTAVVHPSQVAANRARLAALVATNILGQNAPAIAATEAQYMEMWAQDVTALQHDGGSSTAGTALQKKAIAVLGKVDADVAKSCPGDDKAFAHLTASEKKTETDR
jgi:PPE-repeat protein